MGTCTFVTSDLTLEEANEQLRETLGSTPHPVDTWSPTIAKIDQITQTGDESNENANKGSGCNSVKYIFAAEEVFKDIMLKETLKPAWKEAHEAGWIYIHDLGSRKINQINCCLFDLKNVMVGGFWLNGVHYTEPKTVGSAFSVGSDIIIAATQNQYGGFTVPEIDKIMGYFAEKSYNKFKKQLTEYIKDPDLLEEATLARTREDIRQGYQCLETKLNSINNSLGQVPFVTITLGLGTSYWEREVSKCILETRLEGIGAEKTTAVFPKISFLHRAEINGNPDSPNYDLKQLGIRTSIKRMYPDWLSLDDGHLKEVFDRCGEAVSGMGCRAYLSPFIHPETGKEIYLGRFNIGAVTLNLVKMGLEAKGDTEKFFQLVDKYSQIVFEIHEWTYARLAKAKGSSNPLLFTQGGAWMEVGPHDSIEPLLVAATASLGYIGLEECCQAMFGHGVVEEHDFAISVVKHLKENCEAARDQYDHLYALYSTPAESLCYKFAQQLRNQYGVLEGITDREYITNSFHVPVWQEINALDKLKAEAEFHQLATGGKISYVEFPYGVDLNVIEPVIEYAMRLGLYFGVNIVSSHCGDCHYDGDFNDECPKCASPNTTSILRACGYLAYNRIDGETRYNKGKKQEIHQRVKHC